MIRTRVKFCFWLPGFWEEQHILKHIRTILADTNHFSANEMNQYDDSGV